MVIGISFIIVVSSLGIAAQAAETKVATDPTRISVGARILGMGKAYLGRADDIGSLFINPAGLAKIGNWQGTSMSGKFINEFNYLNLGFAYPTRFGTFAFGITSSDISFSGPAATLESIDGVRVVPSTTETVSYGYNNSVMLLGYGIQPWEAISLGLTMKMFSPILTGPQITGGIARGFDMDVGMLYEPSPALHLGVVVQNALPYSWGGKMQWGNGQEESFPSTLKTGLSVKLLGKEGLRRMGKQELKFNFDGDFTPLRPTVPSLYHLGLEWSPVDILDLRVGIDQDIIGKGGGLLDISNNFTAGVGIYLGGFRFDYAFHQYYGLVENDTHYFSVTYGAFKEKLPVEIKPSFLITPLDKSIFYTEQVTLEGEVLNKDIKWVTVNRLAATLVVNKFQIELPLRRGENSFVIEGYDDQGKLSSTQKIRILRLKTFKDLEPSSRAKLPIEQLATRGIMPGFADGTFRPQGQISRVDLLINLLRIREAPTSEVTWLPCIDVKPTEWIAPYVKAGYDSKLVLGYPDLTFRPRRPASRIEAIVMAARFARLTIPKVREKPYLDISARHWAVGEITAAKQENMLKFVLEYLYPDKKITRAEVAELLSKLLDFEQGFEVK